MAGKKTLYRGAEAVLTIEEREGQRVVIKDRVEKGYRIKEIDSAIRPRRTRQEVNMLSRARRAGVPVPNVIDYSVSRIDMEFLQGDRVKDVIGKMDASERGRIYSSIGDCIGRLHEADIMHGDLTTANMIANNGAVHLLDFGLSKASKRSEDKAIDLFLFLEALKSTHPGILAEAWKGVLNAYKQRYLGAGEVLNRMEKIKKRRRYRT